MMKPGESVRDAPKSERRRAALVALMLLGISLGGCDKCGNRIKLNTPAIQHACGDNASPAQ